MDAIADALVYAVAYINCCPLDHQHQSNDQDDAGALETIAGLVAGATPGELVALSAAAKRALAAELALPQPRKKFVEVHSRWMHDLLGDDWEGSRS